VPALSATAAPYGSITYSTAGEKMHMAVARVICLLEGFA